MAITYSIDGGADAAKFNINATSGALTFKVAPDFEKPGDANADNIYEVSVKATDATGLASSKLVKVTVTDVSEGAPPQITSAGAVSVKENSTTVMTITATDPDDTTQPPIEPPVQTGYPDATNTGVPAGTVLTNSGTITTSAVGQVISAKNVSGCINVNHNNVTIEKCKIKGTDWFTIRVKSGVTGLKVQDCEIDSMGTEGAAGILGTGEFRRNNIYNTCDGISLNGSNSVIEDNFIHDLYGTGAPHYDCIQIDGGISHVTVRHNTLDCNHDQTSALMIDNYYGIIDDVLVDNNRLLNGGYTTYCSAQFGTPKITNVRYTNNRFKKGHWGYTAFTDMNPLPVFTGNVDDVTGAPITATSTATAEASDEEKKPRPSRRDE